MANKSNKEKFSLEEAINKAKQSSKANFDETVEVHFNLGIDPKKDDQNIRTTVALPKGTGKSVRVAVFSESKVEDADLHLTESDLSKIENGTLKPNVDFDVIITEPRYMTKLAKVARILGPQGVMPNPKTGTVTEKVEEAVKAIKKGKIEIRSEPNAPILHTYIGKQSFATSDLKENFLEIVKTLKTVKPAKVKPETYINSVFICTTMGASFKVDLNSLE